MQARSHTLRRLLSPHIALAVLAVAGSAWSSPPHQHETSGGVQALDVFGHGDTLDLLLAEEKGGKSGLYHLRSLDGGQTWSPPTAVGGPAPFGPRRGNDPQIASAAGGKIVAAWMTAGTDRWGSGPIATAVSEDGGATWKNGPNPADDGSTDGHGFIDLAYERGRFHAVWLDSRDGRQGLRHATSADGQKWTSNITIKPNTCECCPNTLAARDGKVAVLYRGHDPRDMRVATSENAGQQWSHDGWVGTFGWKFDGCPHAGGGLVYAPTTLHAIVWTGRAGQTGVYHLSSATGSDWSAPRRLGTDTARHPDIAANGDLLAAAWLADEAVWFSQKNADRDWSAPVRLSDASGPPRLVASKSGFRVFWTQKHENTHTLWRSQMLPH